MAKNKKMKGPNLGSDFEEHRKKVGKALYSKGKDAISYSREAVRREIREIVGEAKQKKDEIKRKVSHAAKNGIKDLKIDGNKLMDILKGIKFKESPSQSNPNPEQHIVQDKPVSASVNPVKRTNLGRKEKRSYYDVWYHLIESELNEKLSEENVSKPVDDYIDSEIQKNKEKGEKDLSNETNSKLATIDKKHIVLETEYEDETSEDEEIAKASVPIDIKKLDYIFEKKATSYKYFWFMAIISLAKDKKILTISYKDIVIRMATLAWPIVFEYEIDLGKSDMIAKYLNDILRHSTLIKNISSKVVEAYLNVYYESDGIGKILEPLLKNVPYRFLSPWIRYTTNEEVVEKSNSADSACLYALQDNNIVLNEEWWEYIQKNYTRICNSAERSFVTYLEPQNNHHKLAKFMSKGWNIQ